MKTKKIFGTLTAKLAALALAFGYVGGAWGADPVTIQNERGANISVYEVSSGFYQSGATYTASTDFYITSKAGLIYFRNFVNGDESQCGAYVNDGFSGYTTALQLFQGNIFQSKTVHLLADIDLSGEQWIAIGYQDVDNKGLKNLVFYGTFDAGIYDGNGNLTGRHKISNLDVAESYTTDGPSLKRTYTGLFGRLAGGTATGVKNLTIENATVAGRGYVGAVAGRTYNSGAVVENCHVIGTININGSSAWVGGLVGECRGSIKGSSVSATGTISGLYDVGGLAGGLYQYNTGDGKSVEVSNSAVSNVTVSSGYAYGLGGLVGVAGLAGDDYTSNVTISNNNANNVTVTTDDTRYAGDGITGVLVGYANANKAYAILEDNTITGTTSANENGMAITSQIGADNAETSIVGNDITFNESGKVTGGTFENIPAAAVAEGYTVGEPNAQGLYTVEEFFAVQIGTEKYKTIALAIAAVQSGETIELLADVQLSGTEAVAINKVGTYVIDGKGHTISPAADSAYIYQRFKFGESGQAYDATKNYIVTNLTITGFSDSTYFIRNEGCCVTFADCYITNNNLAAQANSRLILNTHADLTLSGCVIANNTAADSLIDFNSNASGDGTNALAVDGCLFKDNTNGGVAVIQIAEDRAASVANSTFEGNTVNATNNGAVVYFGDQGGDCTGSLFKDNVVNYTTTSGYENRVRVAGAIFTWAYGDDPGTISGNAFVNNSVVKQNENFLTCYPSAIYSGGYYNAQDLTDNYFGGDAPGVGQADRTSSGNAIYAEYGSKPVEATSYATVYTTNPDGPGAAVSTFVYQVKFVNDDGTTLFATNVASGGIAAYEGEMPIKPADASGIYTFSGWNPATVVAVTDAAQTYTALYSSVPSVASITTGDPAVTTYYASFADAIAAAEDYYAANDSYPTITVIDATAELTNSDWKIDNGYLVRKTYVAQIVTNAGATTNKYETVEAALTAAQTAGATIEILANSTETPDHALEVLMGGDITLTAAAPVRVEIAPTAKTSSVDNDGMAYIRSVSAEARRTFTVGENVTLAFPATAVGKGAMYIGYSSATPADMVVNGRLETYVPYVGSLSTLTVNPSGTIKSMSEDLIVRWGATVDIIGTGAEWSDANPQAEFAYVELQGGVTTLKDTYAKGGAWVHIYDRNNKAPDYETKLVLTNAVLATSKINNAMEIDLDITSQIVTPEVVNAGAINIDATGIATPVKVIDYTGSDTMALADYGTVNITDGVVYVDDNDLWVKRLPVAQVISANGATTNKYDTLLAALEAATNGTTVELLSDVDEDVAQIPALQNVTLDFCGHTLTGQLKGYYNKKIDGLLIRNGTIVGRDSNNWANLQIASGSKNVVVENMTLTTVRNNGTRSGYAFYNQSGSTIPLRNVVADGRFYVGNAGSIISIESGTYRNTFGAAHAIQNNGIVAAKGGTFYYNPTTPNNLVADGYVATETTDANDVQCWIIERGPAFAIVTLADGTETEYWDLDEAISALAEGATLTIKPGTYDLANANYTLPKNVKVLGIEENGARVTIKSKPTFNSANGLIIENIDFDGSYAWQPSAVTVHGDATFKNCNIACNQNAVYYSTVNGTLTFDGCTITAGVYALNVGEGTGDVIVKDCTISGWTSFGNTGKTIITGTTFADGDYDYLRFYQDAIVSNCTFNSEMLININETDKKLIVIDSALEGGSSVASIIGEGANDDPIVNNHVAVGTGVQLNENGEIVGGLFETVDNELIAEQYATGANSDSETSASYPTAVGLVEVLALEEQPGATETEATYKVTVVVVDAEGHTVGTIASLQTIAVRVADADAADTALSKFDLNGVIAVAFATAGEDATSITTVELLVKKTAGESGSTGVTYEIHPEAIITIAKSGEDPVTKTIALSNDVLAANASFTFDLDVTALGVAVGDWVKVTHVSASLPAEENLYKAKAGGSGKVVTVTVTHFSTFTATRADTAGGDASLLPSVTNMVVSANLFGALTVNAGTATNAFVAVPFGAFGIGDANITASNLVQAAALSNGDKMYVWNGSDASNQQYDVYEVKDGIWTVAKKVTVAANGAQSEGSLLSPDARRIASGTGVFIERKDTSKPIYVYGQVLTNTVAEMTFGSGLTLVSAPSTNAMAQINLNALAWSGVKDVTVTTTTSGKKIVTSYANADFIYYRNAENKVIRLYHYGEKWGTVSGTWKDATDAAIIPAGTAFWYMNHGSASVRW